MKKLIFGFALLFLAIPCQARIIYVDANGSAEFDNIQAAINDANDHDIVVVFPGTYTGEGNRDINFLGKAITVRGTDPNDPNIVAATIIDCNGTEANPHRGFTFNNGEEPNSILAGLTITNGYGPRDTFIGGDYRSCGGAILCNNCSPTISHCNITGNSAGYYGGGVFCCNWGSKPMITNCTIAGNSAYVGGGISYYLSYPIISHCTIADNSSDGYGGGGIHCLTYDPGGVPGLISNCTIKGNSAEEYGGGVFCDYKTDIIISNCTISGNSAGGGGGICCSDFAINAMFKNCTITGNSATIGGGIYCIGDRVYSTITNCILWDDTAGAGNEIALYEGGSKSGYYVTTSYSLVEGGLEAVWKGVWDPFSDLTWGPGNIDADPCFADPCNGDYHLQSAAGRWDPNQNQWVIDANTSFCIDAGNPGCPTGSEPLPNGNRINMGAYGSTPTASKSPANWRSIADLTNDWVVDFNDLKVFVDYWLETGQCIPSDLNHSQFVDFSDFAIFGKNWLW